MSVAVRRGIAIALVAGLAWAVAYPLLLVATESVRGPGGFTTEFFVRLFSEPREWQALWGSLWTSVASVVLAGVLGIPLAFLFEWCDFPGRRVLARGRLRVSSG